MLVYTRLNALNLWTQRFFWRVIVTQKEIIGIRNGWEKGTLNTKKVLYFNQNQLTYRTDVKGKVDCRLKSWLGRKIETFEQK